MSCRSSDAARASRAFSRNSHPASDLGSDFLWAATARSSASIPSTVFAAAAAPPPSPSPSSNADAYLGSAASLGPRMFAE